jgi:hypothetical protein
MKNLSFFKGALLCLFLSIITLFSCQKEPITSVENDFIQSDERNAIQTRSGQPDQPGDNMKVYRYEGEFIWQFYDAETDSYSFVNFDVIGLCNGDLDIVNVLSFQDIVKEVEGDSAVIHTLVKGKDVSVSVWNLIPDDCDDVTSNEPLFNGTAKFIYNDNDFNAFDNDNPNKNVYGFRLVGKGILITFHAMWDGEDFSTYEQRIKIKIK